MEEAGRDGGSEEEPRGGSGGCVRRCMGLGTPLQLPLPLAPSRGETDRRSRLLSGRPGGAGGGGAHCGTAPPGTPPRLCVKTGVHVLRMCCALYMWGESV